MDSREYSTAQYDVIIVKVKALLFITDTTYDDYMDSLIPMLFEEAEAYCNKYFSTELDATVTPITYTMVIPQPIYLYLAKAMEQNLLQSGVNSEKQGNRSVGYGDGDTIINIKGKYLNKYKGLDWSDDVEYD